ncbi:peptide ABC transporter permease [Levilactobacillus koreensis JCM 16448]|uniref:ABC transporter permease n=1 Tax=Levilactobacillus koreensis TaxID=637971 RepID=A0AAC8UW75_9LACO|nr:ABC transporter permease [Levilactobacillus koreensis]AKP64869.1 ABC transporter permease [Levilactobacillus koreensis]KRK85955.1 peptide ABC transporter permease [Levilactobacillus koreensis JCM 16448]
MNFFKRAWLNVWAKKGRSVLLILVSSAILMFVLAGLLIRSAAVKATDQAKANVGATVTLSANRQAAFKKMQNSSRSKSSRPKMTLTPVKLSDATKITKLSNISSYNVTSSTSVNAKSYDTVSTSSGLSGGNSGGPGGMKSSTSTGDTQIDGVTSTSLATDFSSKQSKITKGRGITAADKNTNHVVIEKDLASQNNLTVGDTITVKEATGSKDKVKLKIVGIYKASSTSSSSAGPMSTDPANTMYTSYTLANTFKGTKYAGTADSVTFNVSNPAKVSSVKTAGKKLINTSKYALSTDDSSYQTVKASMSNVESFANKIVWLVAIAGTIILALIVILMIRERRFEIGVLLSLGEARWKIVAQFFAEMLMVIVVAVAIAGVGGKFVGSQLGSQLVSQSTTTTQTTTSSTGQPGGSGAPGGSGMKGGNGGPGNMSQSANSKAAKTELDVSVSAVNLAELGGFGLAITFLSIMIASGGILRLEPKKVLIS